MSSQWSKRYTTASIDDLNEHLVDTNNRFLYRTKLKDKINEELEMLKNLFSDMENEISRPQDVSFEFYSIINRIAELAGKMEFNVP